MPIWKAQKEVRKKLDMRSVHVNGLPQRYLWCKKPHPNDKKPVSFRILFAVEDVASPRNMLGPLHRKAGYDEPWTDSRSFRTEGNEWTDEYVL